MKHNALTERKIQTARAGAKPVKLTDGGGLHLLVASTGSKYWRWSYRYRGKQKTMAFGVYPDVSLAKAREHRDEARKVLAGGVDPGEVRRVQREIQERAERNTFGALAQEWFDQHKEGWATSHSSKVWRRLENDVFPWLGDEPIARIDAPMLLEVLRRVEERSPETARRINVSVSQIFRYAQVTGRALTNPAAAMKGALKAGSKGHFAAPTNPDDLAGFLRAVKDYRGTAVVAMALRVAPHLFQRPNELRGMRWDDLDLERREWRFVLSKTKREHIVPLSSQVVSMLEELRPLTGHSEFVFAGAQRGRPISPMAMTAALKRLGFDTKHEITIHGLRAVARTILDEVLHVDPRYIELQLGHTSHLSLKGAYDRTRFLPERHRMMQAWSDYLDRLTDGKGVIVPFRPVELAS